MAASMDKAHYSPPWADTSIIGIAGSSGSGKTSLAVEIVSSLNLPWVVILSMVGNILKSEKTRFDGITLGQFLQSPNP